MKVLRTLILCTAGLFLIGNLANSQDGKTNPLIGKWEMKQKVGDKEITGQLEFTKDLKLKISFMGISFSGTYKVLDKENLEVTVTFGDKTNTEKSKYKVVKDVLELTDKKGKTEKFNRVIDKGN